MAIHWCDPYLNTSTGGIHGTTTSGQSSGDGSYASPWSLNELCDQNNYSGWSNGDELRFKGVTEDTFFPPANAETFKQSNQTTDYTIRTDYNGYYQPQLYFASTSNYKLYKVKQQDRGSNTGKTFFYKHHQTSADRVRTIIDENTWYPNLCPLDPNYGYIQLDDRYQISTQVASSTAYFLYYLTARITITAGWTSETQQNGITVLDFSTNSIFNSTTNWGTYESGSYKGPVWDCEDTLVISRYRSSGSWYMYGSVINIYAFCDAGQNYSQWQLYTGTNNSGMDFSDMPAGFNVGDYNVGSVVSTNMKFAVYGNYGSFADTKPIANLQFICQYGGGQTFFDNIVPGTELKIKEIYGYSTAQLNAQNNDYFYLNLLDGWNLEQSNSGSSPIIIMSNNNNDDDKQTFVSNSIVGTQTNDTYYNLGGWTGNNWTYDMTFQLYSWLGYQWGFLQNPTGNYWSRDEKIYSSSNLFEQLSETNKRYAGSYVESIDTKGQPLEDITISPFSWSSNMAYPWAQTIHVRQEPGSMLPVTILAPTSSGYGAMIYNSPNFSYNKSIRFFPECNGEVYTDVVAYDMPTFSSDVSYSATYTTTSSPGVSIIDKLYLYDTSTQRLVNIANISGSVSGTTITCNTTISAASLSNKAGLLIVVHDFSKTTADVAEVSYTSITVT